MTTFTKKITLTIIMLTLIFSVTNSIYASTNQWIEPASVMKVTPEMLNQYIDPRADGETEVTERINGTLTTYTPSAETYTPEDRLWQGLPTISKTGNRLWAAWYTGGTGEPRQFNYIVVAYSDDSGQTWIDPFIVIDHPDPNQDGVSSVVPNFFMDEEGNLCLIYIQYYTWIVTFDNADAENIDDVTWSEPTVLTTSKLHKAPTYFIDEDSETALIYASEAEAGDSHIETTRFYVSKDFGETWNLRASLNSSVPNNRYWPESQVVQTNDLSLMVVSRIESGTAGGIEVSTSNDFGYTWSDYENNLSEPFIGPGSKSHILQLSSGNLLVINHDTTSSRSSLVAYLSLDNGLTFPYSLSLDSRTDVSYPSAYESNGQIYITWDKGRYLEKEIRFATITEQDMIDESYTSENSIELGIISKLNTDYLEIVSVNEAFEHHVSFTVGETSASIRDSLPESLTVIDNQGNEYILDGVWKNPGYYQDVPGTYRFYFQTTLPLFLDDTYDLLSIDVVLVEKSHNNLYYLIGIPFVLVSALSVYIITKRKK